MNVVKLHAVSWPHLPLNQIHGYTLLGPWLGSVTAFLPKSQLPNPTFYLQFLSLYSPHSSTPLNPHAFTLRAVGPSWLHSLLCVTGDTLSAPDCVRAFWTPRPGLWLLMERTTELRNLVPLPKWGVHYQLCSVLLSNPRTHPLGSPLLFLLCCFANLQNFPTLYYNLPFHYSHWNKMDYCTDTPSRHSLSSYSDQPPTSSYFSPHTRNVGNVCPSVWD